MADDKADERVSLKPLKPTQALKALLGVDPSQPDAEPTQCPKKMKGKQCALKAGHLGPCRYDVPPYEKSSGGTSA